MILARNIITGGTWIPDLNESDESEHTPNTLTLRTLMTSKTPKRKWCKDTEPARTLKRKHQDPEDLILGTPCKRTLREKDLLKHSQISPAKTT